MENEEIKNTKRAFKIFYNFLAQNKECVKKIKKNDRKIFKGKVENTFYQNLAILSDDTECVSNDGHRIKYSYCSWREAFFNSTDRKNFKYFTSLYQTTGAMAFRVYNYETESYDYIISLNSDAYDHLSDRITWLTFSHEMGHCLLDHPSNPLPDDIKRDIEREIAADNEGFNFLKKTNSIDLNEYNDRQYLVGNEGFRLKHIANCGMILYGRENIEIITNSFNKEKLDCLKTIAKRFIKLDSDETKEEDSARESNFKKFLSENL